MKSESWIIIELTAMLFALAILSYFRQPSYEKGVWLIMGLFYGALNAVIGFKFGKNMPEQKGDPREGQTGSSETTSTTTTETVTPPVVEPPK